MNRKIKKLISKNIIIIAATVVLLVSFSTHFAFINKQQVTIFDEVYFGTFANEYRTHKYFFDIHPPLGKLLIAGSSALFRADPYAVFDLYKAGNPAPNFMAYRLLPAMFGALLALAIFLILLSLKMPLWGAFFGGMLIAIESSMIAHSRLVLIDSMMLTFGFFGLWTYLKYRLSGSNWWLLVCGLLLAASFSVKWVGLGFVGLVLISEFVKVLKHKKINWLYVTRLTLFLVLVPLVIYILIFIVHFSLLTKSGDGDAFMSTSFQSTLIGNQNYGSSQKTPNIINKIIELNKTMYTASASIKTEHPYSSKWYQWPLSQKPIAYFADGTKTIMFVGNPIIWWLGSVAVLASLILVISKKKFRNFDIKFLLLGYFLSWLPFIVISRVAFMYHYLTAMVFSVMILSWLISKYKFYKSAYAAIILVSIVVYLLMMNKIYGL